MGHWRFWVTVSGRLVPPRSVAVIVALDSSSCTPDCIWSSASIPTIMAVSLRSCFAASLPVFSDSPSGLCIRGPSTSLAAAASFGRSIDRYGRASENRRLMAHGAKWKKPVKPPVSIEKPKPDSPPVSIEKSDSPPVTIENPDSGAPNWEEFGAAVSGEWDGYSAEFNMFAEPLELPSDVVPDAFSEWEQKIHDWQTQCPTLAHPEQGHLWYKVMRLHPTVGCEADAATVYSVEKCDAPQDASGLAYHSQSGSYTAVWRGKRVTNEKQGTGPGKEVTREGDVFEVEQCLVHDKARIRVLQILNRRRHILIFREAYEGPFRNGESLGGCAAVTQAFATQKPLLAKSLFGKWSSDIYTLKDPKPQEGYSCSKLVFSGNEVVERNYSSTFLYLCLPKDTWTLLLKTDAGVTTVETGWLAQPDLAIVTKCEIGSTGYLNEVSLRVEKRISSEVAAVKVSAEELEELLTE